MTIQDARTEIAGYLAGLGAQEYDYIPGAAQLPGIVVGLPSSIDPSLTSELMEVALPVFVVTRSADPAAGESSLLELVLAVEARLGEHRMGTAYRTLRVEDITDFFPVAVGDVEAQSATVRTSVILNR